MVAAGLGLAVVPEAFAGDSGPVGLRLSSAGVCRSIGPTWRTDREQTPPARRFLDFVVDGVGA